MTQKKCDSCGTNLPKVICEYGEKGSAFRVPIGTENE